MPLGSSEPAEAGGIARQGCHAADAGSQRRVGLRVSALLLRSATAAWVLSRRVAAPPDPCACGNHLRIQRWYPPTLRGAHWVHRNID